MIMQHTKSCFRVLGFVLSLSILASCTDFFDSESTTYSTEDTNTLSAASDTVYSVIGILSKVQTIADRLVLMGDLRADLVQENDYTTSDLRELVANDVSATNAYADYRDFYAVINNCNYYLAKADTTVRVSGQKVILKEYAVVKAVRAWTYMQLALIYGEVPFYTDPILKFTDADQQFPKYNLQQVCTYFIDDLLPYTEVAQPVYGNISGIDSRKFFFPVKLVLADMYLWLQNYKQAAFYYADYLSDKKLTTGMIASRVSAINTSDEVTAYSAPWVNSFKGPNVEEIITLIPMAMTKLDGVKSGLSNVFSSTEENDYHYQITPSAYYEELNAAQDYAYSTGARTLKHLSCGDMRYYATYPLQFVSADAKVPDIWDDSDEDLQTNDKYTSGHVFVYRVGTVWLRLAEALNAMGDYENAFAILKRGGEVTTRGDSLLFEFTQTTEGTERYRGIHARGCGEVFRNTVYDLPGWETLSFAQVDETWQRVDTVVTHTVTHSGMLNRFGYDTVEQWNPTHDTLTVSLWSRDVMADYVENLIVDEGALECAFEGVRFYDLMRVALRRGDPTYLATKVARRGGTLQAADEALFSRLSNTSNWYVKHD